METWGWLIVYVAGFGLLQLLLYRHFGRRESTPASSGQSGTTFGTAGAEASGVRCDNCGTHNEATQMVRYCRICVEPLH